ncbi:spore coat protein [Bacillus sp. DTU_2020_1000418_1_SI_GHA_SEK_038]|uniref:spore coat protein n=1 Tax=Bacillus sp. DTU_2020_1000418_1_SI_GHA_SEK_038 TaxID=3077585 RepID=UPI0028E41F5E|nr:spore coat protein [Bacillus sp. DTU_2020_1000418_1_SI_GHA_SEK_038]WNS73983.1 spore coat protein [Bacillus sp. DTU_2020_1000418_1_SI_GHA_SEK_038]
MYCGPRPTNVLPATVSPTKCCVNHTFQNTIVPHIHPSHTTTVNHHNFQHVHSFPHTQSVVNEVTHQQFVAPPGPGVAPFGGPGAFPQAGFGAQPQGPFGVPRPGMYGAGPFFRK